MVVSIFIGVSRDSSNASSEEGKFRDGQETDTAWSQCEPYQQGKSKD